MTPSTSRPRSIRQIVEVEPKGPSGLLHPFPSEDLRHLDPFVFLDTAAPFELGAGDIYVGPHSHRGVQPVSLLFRGRIEHRDSLGNERVVESGGMQWLVAGSGALHEEVLHGDADGTFHMAQLWINVPSHRKMDDPEHHALSADAIPVVELAPGAALRLYAGRVADHQGPAPMPTPVTVGHLALGAGAEATMDVPAGWTAGVTVVAGSLNGPNGRPLAPGATAVFEEAGDAIHLASDAGCEALVMLGEPIGEPVAFGGGFVMNTRDEIQSAFDDEAAGLMGALAPSR